MLQYEYKSVYFVCRKPKFNLALMSSVTENETNENGQNIHIEEEEEENNTKNFTSDIDDHYA